MSERSVSQVTRGKNRLQEPAGGLREKRAKGLTTGPGSNKCLAAGRCHRIPDCQRSRASAGEPKIDRGRGAGSIRAGTWRSGGRHSGELCISCLQSPPKPFSAQGSCRAWAIPNDQEDVLQGVMRHREGARDKSKRKRAHGFQDF